MFGEIMTQSYSLYAAYKLIKTFIMIRLHNYDCF